MKTKMITMREFYARLVLVIIAFIPVLLVVQLTSDRLVHVIAFLAWFAPTFLALDRSQIEVI